MVFNFFLFEFLIVPVNYDHIIIIMEVAKIGFKSQLSWNSKLIIQIVSLHTFEQWKDKHIHSFIKQIGL